MLENHPQGEQITRTFVKLTRQSTDRRGFITGAGKLASAGAIALALTSSSFRTMLANHAGTADPDLSPGNIGQMYQGQAGKETEDCYDFDGDGNLTDFDVVQFALFLEHLENAFYRQALETFSASDFQRGLRVFREGSLKASGTIFVDGTKVREAVERVSLHERSHAEDLSGLLTSLGAKPTVECQSYNFDFSSVETFARTAQLLENVGVAAYVGAASCISEPNYIRVAASIATVEARHATYFDALTANTVFPSAYDLARPMGATADLVLASGLVGSCPQPSGAPQPPFGRS